MTTAANDRAVFFDRDGVLNISEVRQGRPYAPRTLDAFHIVPDAAHALHRVKAAGYRAIVTTNQPDVGNGLVARQEVDAMHHLLRSTLPVDDIRACFHSQSEGCTCRKPAPGMLYEASDAWRLDLTKCFMVGDRWSDIAAGKAAGCRTVFIDHGYTEPNEETPSASVKALDAAVDWILANKIL